MSEENKENNSSPKKEKHNKVVRESHLDFLYDLYAVHKIELDPDKMQLLRDNGYINEPLPEKKEEDFPDFISTDLSKSTKTQFKTDENVDILYNEEVIEVISDKDLEARKKLGGYIFEGRKTEIQREEWLPKDIIEHEQDFIDFIDSIFDLGFQSKRNYRKLNLYVQQAYTWLAEKGSYLDFVNEFDKDEFIQEELRRCDINTLYFLNKYVYYQEGSAGKNEGGKYKYVASPAHELMAYMNDCGYSMGIIKGRQIAATTTFMACDVKDMIFKKNHFMKFITEDQEKAEEIFEDKLKYCFSELPDWMRPTVQNDRDNYFKLGKKEEKGDRGGVNSRIRVVPPKRTAVAGGAPQKVKIDEAGNIKDLTIMLNNARPTMFMYNPNTGKLEIKRQCVWWGTGGEFDRGGMAFHVEFMSLLSLWRKRNFKSGFVPLFFNWWCRPGATQEIYDSEKLQAYSKEGPDLKKSIIEFHQSWPSTISDVFMASEKTLVSTDYIDQQINRIKTFNAKHGHGSFQKGYFEPIYDLTSPSDDSSDTPFKIVGANFIPTADNDNRATTVIFGHPRHGWKNRYFQGTDPIATDTGQSDMSGAVWDKHFKTVSAIMFSRNKDYRQTFLQNLLLNLYYDLDRNLQGAKELVESNIGQSYTQYKISKGFNQSMVFNYELPAHLINKTTINEGIGIDNKGLRNTAIVNKLHEVIQAYGENIYMEIFWEQLKTFVCEVTDKGKETWGPVNRKYFKDDTLFSVVYSYICAEEVYKHLVPENLEDTKKKQELVRYELAYDNDYNLKRMPVRYVNGKPANTIPTRRR